MSANPISRRRSPEGTVTLLRTRDTALLVAARKAAGLTQRMVAGELGISLGMVCSIETGKRQPSLKVGQALADLYGVSLHGLFDEIPLLYGEPEEVA